MQLEHMSEFIALAKHLNITKAAVELNVMPSTLSKHVMAMEKELGFRLLVRTRPLQLTPAGGRFLEHAQQIVGSYEAAVEDCRRAIRSAPPVRLQWFEGDDCEAFLATLDDLPFSLSMDRGDESFFQELEDGRVDVTVGLDVSISESLSREAEERGVEVRPIGSRRNLLVVPRANALSGKAALRREDLAGQEFAVANGTVFDTWAEFHRCFFGPELGIKTVLRPINGNYNNMRRLDLGQALFMMSEEIVSQYWSKRPDVVVYGELDGSPIMVPQCLMAMADNPNPNVALLLDRAVEFFEGRRDG